MTYHQLCSRTQYNFGQRKRVCRYCLICWYICVNVIKTVRRCRFWSKLCPRQINKRREYKFRWFLEDRRQTFKKVRKTVKLQREGEREREREGECKKRNGKRAKLESNFDAYSSHPHYFARTKKKSSKNFFPLSKEWGKKGFAGQRLNLTTKFKNVASCCYLLFVTVSIIFLSLHFVQRLASQNSRYIVSSRRL
jgi:hypothetical protein